MPKPSTHLSEVESMLRQYWEDASDFRALPEGLDSVVFSFRRGDAEYIVRINTSMEGFRKDAFVSRKFASRALPIPDVIEIGRLYYGAAFCVSRRAPGVRLQDLDAAAMDRMVQPVARVMAAIASSDLAGTAGFGRFDSYGAAPYARWREFLTGLSDPGCFEGRLDGPMAEVVNEAVRQVDELAEYCPEERRLIHGDFGSCNALSDGSEVTAVIDWDLALFGDPLYDVANLFFWHETQLEPLIRHFESNLAGLPQWRERIRCYQLRIGLQEVYDSAGREGPWDVPWLTTRLAEIIGQQATT